jgi:predicted anti-sigma-YlaC factor YlaD
LVRIIGVLLGHGRIPWNLLAEPKEDGLVVVLAFQQTLRWRSPISLLLLLLLRVATTISGLRVHVGSWHSIALGRSGSVLHRNWRVAASASKALTSSATAPASAVAALGTTIGRFVDPDGSTVKPKIT